MLFCDEAVVSTDKEAQARLKGLITEPHMLYEAKGIDISLAQNRLHVMLASNDAWFVNAGASEGERRYFVSQVNNNRQNDFEFFRKLHNQMFDGGLNAMLYEMQNRELGEWTPRDNIPVTDALIEQKRLSMNPVEIWWSSQLESQKILFDPVDSKNNWHQELYVVSNQLFESFTTFCSLNRLEDMTLYMFMRTLRKICPGLSQCRVKPSSEMQQRHNYNLDTAGRTTCYSIPSFEECLAAFEKITGIELKDDFLL